MGCSRCCSPRSKDILEQFNDLDNLFLVMLLARSCQGWQLQSQQSAIGCQVTLLTRPDVLRSLEIKPTDFVVELGGGHQPFDRSDVIFDKYPFDNIHRSQDLVHAAPVIIANAARLPLENDGCDVIFASHILEHLPDPQAFLCEAQRCSQTIYLEFPRMSRELMFAWSFHEWVIMVQDTHLTFYKNDIPQLFGDFFHSNYDFLFDAWNLQRHNELNTWIWCQSNALTWEFASEGAFAHAVSTSCTGSTKVNEVPCRQVDYTWGQVGMLLLKKALPQTVLDRLVKARRRQRRGGSRTVTPALVRRLACIICRTACLELSGEIIHCLTCGQEYRQQQGLFNLDVAVAS